MLRKILHVALIVTFLFNNAAYGLAPENVSNNPSDPIRGEMFAAGQKLFGIKHGPGSIDFDKALAGSFVGTTPRVNGIKTVTADYSRLPKGWENNPVLQEKSIVKALQYFRDNEAKIPADALAITEGYYEVDSSAGEVPTARLIVNADGTSELVIHTEFARMWEHIRANDVWFDYTFPDGATRTVSLAWAIFYRVAKHEMADRRKIDDILKGGGHAVSSATAAAAGVEIDADETSANYIGGRYSTVNDGMWMWFLGSYCFGDSTRYDNRTLEARLRWFFNPKNEADGKLGLASEFPRLTYLDGKAELAIHAALTVNHAFFSRKGMTALTVEKGWFQILDWMSRGVSVDGSLMRQMCDEINSASIKERKNFLSSKKFLNFKENHPEAFRTLVRTYHLDRFDSVFNEKDHHLKVTNLETGKTREFYSATSWARSTTLVAVKYFQHDREDLRFEIYDLDTMEPFRPGELADIRKRNFHRIAGMDNANHLVLQTNDTDYTGVRTTESKPIVTVCDAETGQAVKGLTDIKLGSKIRDGDSGVSFLAERYLLISSFDGKDGVYDMATGERLAHMDRNIGGVIATSSTVAVMRLHSLYVYDNNSREVLRVSGVSRLVALMPGHVVYVTGNNDVVVTEIATGKNVFSARIGDGATVGFENGVLRVNGEAVFNLDAHVRTVYYASGAAAGRDKPTTVNSEFLNTVLNSLIVHLDLAGIDRSILGTEIVEEIYGRLELPIRRLDDLYSMSKDHKAPIATIRGAQSDARSFDLYLKRKDDKSIQMHAPNVFAIPSSPYIIEMVRHDRDTTQANIFGTDQRAIRAQIKFVTVINYLTQERKHNLFAKYLGLIDVKYYEVIRAVREVYKAKYGDNYNDQIILSDRKDPKDGKDMNFERFAELLSDELMKQKDISQSATDVILRLQKKIDAFIDMNDLMIELLVSALDRGTVSRETAKILLFLQQVGVGVVSEEVARDVKMNTRYVSLGGDTVYGFQYNPNRAKRAGSYSSGRIGRSPETILNDSYLQDFLPLQRHIDTEAEGGNKFSELANPYPHQPGSMNSAHKRISPQNASLEDLEARLKLLRESTPPGEAARHREFINPPFSGHTIDQLHYQGFLKKTNIEVALAQPGALKELHADDNGVTLSAVNGDFFENKAEFPLRSTFVVKGRDPFFVAKAVIDILKEANADHTLPILPSSKFTYNLLLSDDGENYRVYVMVKKLVLDAFDPEGTRELPLIVFTNEPAKAGIVAERKAVIADIMRRAAEAQAAILGGKPITAESRAALKAAMEPLRKLYNAFVAGCIEEGVIIFEGRPAGVEMSDLVIYGSPKHAGIYKKVMLDPSLQRHVIDEIFKQCRYPGFDGLIRDIIDSIGNGVSRAEEALGVSSEKMAAIESGVFAEMGHGLAGRESSLAMLPSFVAPPTGRETGDYYAIDVGGSNLRVLGVRLKGDGTMSDIGQSRSAAFTKAHKTGSADQLFDYIADNIAKYIAKNRLNRTAKMRFGLTWSFPVEQKAVDSGILKEWTKGWRTTGVVGEDVVALLRAALKRKGLDNVEIAAICNDTVGTLATARYQDKDCVAGIILGTGTNAAIPVPVADIQRLGASGQGRGAGQMMVNLEWGNFDKVDRTPWDETLDAETVNAGKQLFEKMVSGMFLGEVVRLVANDMIGNDGLFGGRASEVFSAAPGKDDIGAKGFLTEYLSRIEGDDSPDLSGVGELLKELGIPDAPLKDRAALKSICGFVSTRSARVVASAMAALVRRVDPEMKSQRISLAVDGSLFEKHPNYRSRLESAIAEMFPEDHQKIVLIGTKDGSGRGAAIIAAMASSQKEQDQAKNAATAPATGRKKAAGKSVKTHVIRAPQERPAPMEVRMPKEEGKRSPAGDTKAVDLRTTRGGTPVDVAQVRELLARRDSQSRMTVIDWLMNAFDHEGTIKSEHEAAQVGDICKRINGSALEDREAFFASAEWLKFKEEYGKTYGALADAYGLMRFRVSHSMGFLYPYDLETGKQLPFAGMRYQGHILTPKLLFVETDERDLDVYDLEKGEHIKRYLCAVRSWDHNKTHLALITDDGNIAVIDLKTGTIAEGFEVMRDHSSGFRLTERTLVVTYDEGGKTVEVVYDLATGAIINDGRLLAEERIVSDLILHIGKGYGPGSEDLAKPMITDARVLEDLYKTLALLSNDSGIEVLLHQKSIKMTEPVKTTLVRVRANKGENSLRCAQFLGKDGLLRQLSEQGRDPGKKRILVVSDKETEDAVHEILNERPELLKDVRVINVGLPGDYDAMGTNDKSVCQMDVIVRAVLARIVEKSGTIFARSTLARMLEGRIQVDVDTYIDDLISAADETPGAVKDRILKNLGVLVSLVEKIGVQMIILRDFVLCAA